MFRLITEREELKKYLTPECIDELASKYANYLINSSKSPKGVSEEKIKKNEANELQWCQWSCFSNETIKMHKTIIVVEERTGNKAGYLIGKNIFGKDAEIIRAFVDSEFEAQKALIEDLMFQEFDDYSKCTGAQRQSISPYYGWEENRFEIEMAKKYGFRRSDGSAIELNRRICNGIMKRKTIGRPILVKNIIAS